MTNLNFADPNPALPTLAAHFGNLNSGDQKFATSLMAQAATKALSPKQAYWVEKLAERAATPAAPKAGLKVGATFAGVQALFLTAKANLKRPSIKLALEDGGEVALSLAGAQSKNPGFVYVRLDGTYVGKISPAGEFFTYNLDPDLKAPLGNLLAGLAADPAGVAAAYGKLTGNCCFCSRALTDERSTSVGYGPVCAGHYNLPWGEEA